MRYLLFIGILTVITLCAGLAHAQDGKGISLYMSGAIGHSTIDALDWKQGNVNGNVEEEKTYSFAMALGFNLTPHFATELEVSYRNAGLDELSLRGGPSADLTGDHKAWAGMLNSYLYLFPESTVKPFISFGIGAIHHDISLDRIPALGVSGFEGTDTEIALQAGAGINYKIGDNTDLIFGYRYLTSERPELGNTEMDYGVHEARIGIRQTFGPGGDS